MDEYNGIDEIDYLVVVPDALTEVQMQSLYNDHNEDIEGFLSANGLTPTVKYTFENDNKNMGTAVGLPPISFQTPDDVYTTAGIKLEIPSVNSQQITSYGISTNNGTAFQSGTMSPPLIVNPDASHITVIVKYKWGTHRGSIGLSSMLIQFKRGGTKYGGIQYDGSKYDFTASSSTTTGGFLTCRRRMVYSGVSFH